MQEQEMSKGDRTDKIWKWGIKATAAGCRKFKLLNASNRCISI